MRLNCHLSFRRLNSVRTAIVKETQILICIKLYLVVPGALCPSMCLRGKPKAGRPHLPASNPMDLEQSSRIQHEKEGAGKWLAEESGRVGREKND